MELTSGVRRLIFKFSFISLTCCVLLWFSVFSYGLLYYLYIPSIAHIKPVHLIYDSRCIKDKLCAFPFHNVTLVETGHHDLLSRGQAYAIELALEMPESERNIQQGMFMIHLDMLSEKGEVLKTSRRPALLHYRSPLFKTIFTLFFVPALLAGTVEEKQSLSVPLFEKYVENCHQPTFYAFLEIESTEVEVYSCSLRIHAQFTGLRYMMYYWPMLSAIVGIGTNFFFISIIVIFVWIRQIVNTSQFINVSALTREEQDLVNEIRQSVNRSHSSKDLETEETGISRADEFSDMDSDSSDVEVISPHEDPGNKSLRWYRPTSQTLASSSISEPSTSRQDNLSSEIDNIMNISQPSPSELSPTLRKRIGAE
ncbi:hypothetical protein JTE90_025926 [Oedothorax gibbosus]|uniref:Seipin n=1 Tax=Oedothorax gibbosus TaxID=931172 RepID=A0AAV6UAX2_9ARAC|nr:hypothetical protein JTE90_025926 [Oedothorax gibbosus]